MGMLRSLSTENGSRALAVALLALGAVAWRVPGDDRPNLVLYFPDTISAEAFGPSYGNPITKTPYFDKWAANATIFDTAFSSFPQCSPSRAALFTGRHVHTLGHRTMTHLVQPYEQNMFAMLKDSGYATYMFGKNDALAQASFNTTFHYWFDAEGVAQGESPFAFDEAGYYSFMAGASTHPGDDWQHNGDLKAVYLSLALLNSSRVREPFALFLPGIGAHPPYGIPADYANMYDPATIKAQMPLRSVNDTQGKPPYYGQGGIRAYRNITTFDEDFSYQVAAQYFARVTYSDYVFGMVRVALAVFACLRLIMTAGYRQRDARLPRLLALHSLFTPLAAGGGPRQARPHRPHRSGDHVRPRRLLWELRSSGKVERQR